MTAPFINPADYPKFDTVADPASSPVKQLGKHFWVRLTDADRHLSCLWCGELHTGAVSGSNCTGRPRLDILHAPMAQFEPELIVLPQPVDPTAHVTTEHAVV